MTAEYIIVQALRACVVLEGQLLAYLFVIWCAWCQLTECSELERSQGLVIPCMISYIDNVTHERCREILGRLERLVFTHYQLVYKFVEHCGADITRTSCGRTPSEKKKKHQVYHTDT